MIFPLEIWERIFSFADVITLVSLKSVCRLWNELINRALQGHNGWYKRCKTDIPEKFWDSLCEKLSPDRTVDSYTMHNTVLWMSMLKLWYKCSNTPRHDMCFQCVEPLSKHRKTERITCVTSSRDLLAFGTSAGYIYFYNVNDLNTPVYVSDQKQYVKNIQILRNEKNIVAYGSVANDIINILDVISETTIQRRWGNMICTNYNNCYTVTNNTVHVEGSIPAQTISFVQDNIVVVGAENNKVFLYTEGGEYVKLILPEMYCTQKIIQPPRLSIRRYYAFKPEMIVYVTEFGYMGFLVNGGEWKVYDISATLHGIPTAVFVCAQLLILGLNTGDVYVYRVEDFDNLNFNSKNSKAIVTEFTPVVAIDIIIRDAEEHLLITHQTKAYIAKYS